MCYKQNMGSKEGGSGLVWANFNVTDGGHVVLNGVAGRGGTLLQVSWLTVVSG